MFTPESQRQLDNLNKLIAMWQRVDPVTVHLRQYACGSLHCLGGHTALRPDIFPGITANRVGGYPMMVVNERVIAGAEIAEYLFGDTMLFRVREDHPADCFHRGETDYEVALARMHYAKDQLCRRNSDFLHNSPAQGTTHGK